MSDDQIIMIIIALMLGYFLCKYMGNGFSVGIQSEDEDAHKNFSIELPVDEEANKNFKNTGIPKCPLKKTGGYTYVNTCAHGDVIGTADCDTLVTNQEFKYYNCKGSWRGCIMDKECTVPGVEPCNKNASGVERTSITNFRDPAVVATCPTCTCFPPYISCDNTWCNKDYIKVTNKRKVPDEDAARKAEPAYKKEISKYYVDPSLGASYICDADITVMRHLADSDGAFLQGANGIECMGK